MSTLRRRGNRRSVSDSRFDSGLKKPTPPGEVWASFLNSQERYDGESRISLLAGLEKGPGL